jgi:hypothetical protein
MAMRRFMDEDLDVQSKPVVTIFPIPLAPLVEYSCYTETHREAEVHGVLKNRLETLRETPLLRVSPKASS